MADYYDDDDEYEKTCGQKFQSHFVYCFIPTLCIMFDLCFITIGAICLAKGGDSDFSTCDDAAGDHGRSALTQNRRPSAPSCPTRSAASARSPSPVPLHLTARGACVRAFSPRRGGVGGRGL
jgi:hypothetical protein